VRLSRHGEALTWLEGVEEPLSGYAAWQRAEALVALGRHPEARAALDEATVPRSLRPELELLGFTARALAPDAVAPWLAGQAQPSRALRYAAAVRLVDDPALRETAVRWLRQVWEDASPGGLDDRAATQLASLGVDPGDPVDDDARASIDRRIRSLERAYRLPEALELSARRLDGELPTDTAGRLALARRRSKARDHEGALELWPQILGAPDESVGPADRMFEYALTWARTGDYATAATVYQRLIAQHPGSKQADFASYKLGYMSWDEGDCAEAVERFDNHLSRYPSTDHHAETLWFRARCRWVSGERAEAVDDLQALLSRHGGSSLAPGATYWLAVHQLQIDASAGREALEGLVERWPTSGYTWFALERLGRTLPAREVAEPPSPAPLTDQPAAARAVALLEGGLDHWARAELSSVRADSRGERLALAWLWLEAGGPAEAKKLACRYAPDPWEEGDPVATQACTPRPEHRLVEAVARRHGLQPAIPYGVMVAESALKPEVTSPAGARGLMQLMPEVAEGLHDSLFPGRPFDADDLYIAPYNAALGTEELGRRAASLRGLLQGTDVPAVVASYNGGEEAVRRWAASFEGPPPFDAFAEAISYTETRRYVRRVLGYAMAVRWVYGDAASSGASPPSPGEK